MSVSLFHGWLTSRRGSWALWCGLLCSGCSRCSWLYWGKNQGSWGWRIHLWAHWVHHRMAMLPLMEIYTIKNTCICSLYSSWQGHSNLLAIPKWSPNSINSVLNCIWLILKSVGAPYRECWLFPGECREWMLLFGCPWFTSGYRLPPQMDVPDSPVCWSFYIISWHLWRLGNNGLLTHTCQ